jgi:hypothetical protein
MVIWVFVVSAGSQGSPQGGPQGGNSWMVFDLLAEVKDENV